MKNGVLTVIWILLWAAILGEEVGEFNQSILHDFYGGKHAAQPRGDGTNSCCSHANY